MFLKSIKGTFYEMVKSWVQIPSPLTNKGEINMCNNIIIETHYDYEEIWKIFKEIFGEEYYKHYMEEYYSDVTWWPSDTNFNEVAITGYNGVCFCNIKDEDKIKMFDFILKISNVLS
jgi:hypothetical protein